MNAGRWPSEASPVVLDEAGWRVGDLPLPAALRLDGEDGLLTLPYLSHVAAWEGYGNDQVT